MIRAEHSVLLLVRHATSFNWGVETSAQTLGTQPLLGLVVSFWTGWAWSPRRTIVEMVIADPDLALVATAPLHRPYQLIETQAR
jgi:hypothetical protein